MLMLLADARLPTGAHTQSAGLEPALRRGRLARRCPPTSGPGCDGDRGRGWRRGGRPGPNRRAARIRRWTWQRGLARGRRRLAGANRQPRAAGERRWCSAAGTPGWSAACGRERPGARALPRSGGPAGRWSSGLPRRSRGSRRASGPADRLRRRADRGRGRAQARAAGPGRRDRLGDGRRAEIERMVGDLARVDRHRADARRSARR